MDTSLYSFVVEGRFSSVYNVLTVGNTKRFSDDFSEVVSDSEYITDDVMDVETHDIAGNNVDKKCIRLFQNMVNDEINLEEVI